MVRFELLKTCATTGARRGRLHTSHGIVETPFFMPVGTYGAVKTIGSEDLEALGFQQILSNTYHLSERPGSEAIQGFGGLHRFMSWPGAILTDSGGYQVMSLSAHRKISDQGVRFKSHLDGSERFLSPERSIQIQAELGVDVSMALDVCPPYPCTKEEAAEAMRLTHDWAPRNLAAAGEDQAVFGIVQGGVHEDLRAESAEVLSSLPFAGYAIGGVCVGEPTDMQYPVVEYTAPKLPKNRARYLMGVGHPKDILHAVAAGIDMFDCVLPTRMARHHSLYTLRGRVNALNASWASVEGPFDPESAFEPVSRYSAAYVRHLFKTSEPLAQRLATLHNLAFYARMMSEIRDAIETDRWPELMKRYESS
jgi:queuine tRNA-ribosyltransferase